MFHVWDITIPANTLESEPLKQELPLTAGVINRIDIKFPAGCHGMVKVHILRWTFQLVPLTSGEWITGDDETIPTETYYELLEVPIFLEFQGCSPDTDYEHKVTVRVEINPQLKASDIQIIDKLEKLVQAVVPDGA
jgi:hypothetical protein